MLYSRILITDIKYFMNIREMFSDTFVMTISLFAMHMAVNFISCTSYHLENNFCRSVSKNFSASIIPKLKSALHDSFEAENLISLSFSIK